MAYLRQHTPTKPRKTGQNGIKAEVPVPFIFNSLSKLQRWPLDLANRRLKPLGHLSVALHSTAYHGFCLLTNIYAKIVDFHPPTCILALGLPVET